MGELRMMPKGKIERRERLKRMAIRFGLPASTAKAMRTSDITFWLRCNAPRAEPLEQIARRLLQGHLAEAEKNREQDVRVGQNGRGRKPRSSQCKASPQLVATAGDPRRAFVLRRPDEETLAFWRMTADDENEYVSRVARFSRALDEESARKTARQVKRNTNHPKEGI